MKNREGGGEAEFNNEPKREKKRSLMKNQREKTANALLVYRRLKIVSHPQNIPMFFKYFMSIQ